MCIFGGDGGAGDEAKRARAEEAARQARIKTGIGGIDSAFSGFDSNFYDGRKQAYLNFAMPQLNEQHDDAYRGLTYQLARQGLNESSTGADRFGRLQKTYDMNRQGVVDKGMETANNARRAAVLLPTCTRPVTRSLPRVPRPSAPAISPPRRIPLRWASCLLTRCRGLAPIRERSRILRRTTTPCPATT
jgi:hypothetical protein